MRVLFLLIFIASFPAAAQTADIDLSHLPAYSTTYDPQRDAFADGHAALKLAKSSQRRVLIELGGDWCKWCHAMDAFFDQNPDVKRRLHETFVMLKVNVSDENDNQEFLAAFPRPLGYPHMYVAETDGNLLHSQDTGEFVVNGRYSAQKFNAFFDRWTLKKTTETASNVQ